MISFIHKNLRHTEYRLQARENTKKMSHVTVNCKILMIRKNQPQVNWSASSSVMFMGSGI